MTDKQALPLEVCVINRLHRVALLTNGTQVPVTHWFDHHGEDCHPNVAVTCVAGQDGLGWFSIDLAGFRPATVH